MNKKEGYKPKNALETLLFTFYKRVLSKLKERKGKGMRKSIAVIMLAMMAISSFALIPNLASADYHFQGLWVRVGGVVTRWDTTRVFGWMGAFAAMIDANGTYYEWARAGAIWSTETRRLNYSEPPTPENFTFSFYAAKLVETSAVRLNYSGYNFYIAGKWNVINVTTTILVDGSGALISFTQTIETMFTNATGELGVLFASWWLFDLSIDGIDLLRGFLTGGGYYYTEIKICDLDGDGEVDLIDLVKVAKRYRTIPGLWNYNQTMDLNYDNKIDIGDLTTVAANMES